MKSSLVFVALVATFAASPAFAAMSAGAGAGLVLPTVDDGHATAKHRAILQLREEGLKMQTADGGKLTETHRAYLQAKYDAIRAGNY
jgi:hypothetical protein